MSIAFILSSSLLGKLLFVLQNQFLLQEAFLRILPPLKPILPSSVLIPNYFHPLTFYDVFVLLSKFEPL